MRIPFFKEMRIGAYILKQKLAGRKPDARGVRGFHQPVQPVGRGLHIAIDDGQPLSRACLNPAVDGAAETGVRSHADDARAQPLSHFRRAVFGAVVDDQNFSNVMRLRLQAGQQPLQHGAAIPNRNDDRDLSRNDMRGS